MKKTYDVEGSSRVQVKMTFNSETREEAAKLFRETHPDYPIDSIIEYNEDGSFEEHIIVGICESSGKTIFEGMEYVSDEDGVKVLKSEMGE
jgi:hypothetical protein